MSSTGTVGRPVGRRNIRAWDKHRLIKKLADMGDRTHEELAEEFDVGIDTIHQFKHRNKAAIQAIVEGWAEQFDTIWAVNKENRLMLINSRIQELQDRMDELTRAAEQATERLRSLAESVGEDYTGPELVNGPEWRAYSREQTKLLDQIADETGQKPNRTAAEPARGPVLRTVVEGVDLNAAFFGEPATEAAEVLR